jgi:hypothetical protein
MGALSARARSAAKPSSCFIVNYFIAAAICIVSVVVKARTFELRASRSAR